MFAVIILPSKFAQQNNINKMAYRKLLMKYIITILLTMITMSLNGRETANDIKDTLSQLYAYTTLPNEGMLVRISEIEVYPEYLKEYLEFAHNVGVTSVKEEPGVICIYPMQQLRNDCQIRILEIYASQEAYRHHIQTPHFQTYKQGTLHMVKSLDLVDMSQMAPEALPLIFNKSNNPTFLEIASSRYSCKKFSTE